VKQNESEVCKMTLSGVARWIGKMAKAALVEEALTTPKPGLVDRFSNGAHADMNLNMFLESAAVLEPYFVRMTQLGQMYYQMPERIFWMIRQVGLEAEHVMYATTGGVNTHKGAIFTMGILSAAAGACFAREGRIELEKWLELEQSMVQKPLLKELQNMSCSNDDGDRYLLNVVQMTHGEQNLVRYGSYGVRGEAALGYPSVRELALPALSEGRRRGTEWNLVKLQALFLLMSQVEDGNVLSRTGMEGLKEVQGIAKGFLDQGGAYQQDAIDRLREMDALFIDKNYSNGGCADLLAAAIFIESIAGRLTDDRDGWKT